MHRIYSRMLEHGAGGVVHQEAATMLRVVRLYGPSGGYEGQGDQASSFERSLDVYNARQGRVDRGSLSRDYPNGNYREMGSLCLNF